MPQTAKLFMNGRSQAVRLPAEFRFEGREVFIERVGDTVVLRPKPAHLDQWMETFFASRPAFPDDFLANRADEPPQEREWFDAQNP